MQALKVGPGCMRGKEENEMGPVVSDSHQKKVLGYIDKGVSEGATLVVDGRKPRVPGYDEGYYVGGTLFDNVDAGDDHLAGRDFLGRCWGLCASPTITARWNW
ncbi:Methylmalonate semialdehyde dehydrogenase [acylating] [Raoultella terrigena]|uniref:Methylmalonate semialdehyde dehydrogenase [acylating] n=1 Tax=Raoultella terrigena TaxID=577 RepID=A0A4U9D7W2_RAOTE|nr:Methylmalonate semialdehyde dehydrogenase [acylating] [Raoultella terrigena]